MFSRDFCMFKVSRSCEKSIMKDRLYVFLGKFVIQFSIMKSDRK